MKMKRLLALLLVFSLLLSTGVVLAQGPGPMELPSRAMTQQQQGLENMEDRLEYRNEVLERTTTIRENNWAIRDARLKVRDAMAEVREVLLALQEDPDFTEEELAEIRESFRLIQANRKTIGATIGQIKAEARTMRQHRANGDLGAALVNLDRVIAIQEARLTALDNILTEITELLVTLEVEEP